MSTLGQFVPPVDAKLTAGDPIKSPQAILRYALPIDNKPIRQIQGSLESINEALRIPGPKSLGPVVRSVKNAQNILKKERSKIVAAFAPDKKAEGEAALAELQRCLDEFEPILENKDKQAVPLKQREALDFVGKVEYAMVQGFPFEVPPEYASLPQLLGQATMEMKVYCSLTPEGTNKPEILRITVDGFNAPISAGMFVDLVERQFYDGMEIQRADGFVVQTGDPSGPEDGFKDPKTGEIRRVPFEIKVEGDKEPIYDLNLQDLGRVNDQPMLPFDSFGTLAWARNEFENNSASSQVFFLLKESELTPSSANLLDGRFAVFGYITDNQEALAYMQPGDKIEYVKVISGGEFLKNGPNSSIAAPAPAPAPELKAEGV